jgi:anti-anti-sigma factor
MAYVESDEGARGTVESALDATGASIVRISGEIDMSNAELLGQSLEQIVGAGRGPLVVDLAALEFMDSSGIAILLRAAARVDSIEVRNPSSTVRRIIECTGLTDVLHLGS